MIDFLIAIWNIIANFARLFATNNMPNVPNLRMSNNDRLPDKGRSMGVLILGRPGTGKTTYVAQDMIDYLIAHPDEAVFVYDWSGSLTDMLLELIECQPENIRRNLRSRLIYDELGNPDYVVPLPEFSTEYGSVEEQVQRVSENMENLQTEMVSNAPIMAKAGLLEIFPEICRLLSAINDGSFGSWQLTEAKKLIVDKELLKRALNKYGQKAPSAKYYLEKVFLNLKDTERETRTYAILAMLAATEPVSARARLGYFRPGWTPKSAIEQGKLVILNASRMINQRNAQHFLITQVHSLVMKEINKRTPGDPKDKPVTIVMDETYSLLSIPGMAKEIGMIAPLYRSRKVQPVIVLQSLSQLAEPLDEQIWSLGNKVVFALENKNEAEEVARQLCRYDPGFLKLPVENGRYNQNVEPEHGQDRLVADWIQNFRFRECVVQEFLSEREKNKYVLYIPKTRDVRHGLLTQSVQQLKDQKLREYGIPIKDALAVVNRRQLPSNIIYSSDSPTI